jgi:signal transduction histidine kinase
LPHIFDHFFRADKARASNLGGTGLGLAIVKKIIERHQGRIEIESIPGQGSSFRIWLPISTNSN